MRTNRKDEANPIGQSCPKAPFHVAWERRGIAAVPIAIGAILVTHFVAKVAFGVLAIDESVPAFFLALVASVIAIAATLVGGAPRRRRWAAPAALVLSLGAALSVAHGRLPAVALISSLELSALFALWAARALPTRLPESLDGVAKRRRTRAILWSALGVFAVLQTARLSSFMTDFSFRVGSTFPPDVTAVKHMCVSAYVYAADLNRRGIDNVYQHDFYPAFHTDDTGAASDQPAVAGLADHLEDPYAYPPPFLMLPRLALAITNQFDLIRTAWFAIQALFVAGVALILARWIGGREGMIAGLLFPAVWISIPTMFGLQFGQIQLLVIAMAMLALVLFEEDRRVAPGALLAAACTIKIFPGILLLHLAFRRRWWDVAATCGFVLGYAVLGGIVLGSGPFVAFFSYQLPRLVSGQAFSFFEKNPAMIAANESIYGLAFKLAQLGSGEASRGLASALSYIFLAALVGVTAFTARRSSTRLERAQLLLALLNLAALRAPFAPSSYVPASTLWLLSLLAPDLRARAGRVIVFVIAWILISGLPPAPSPIANLIASLLVQGSLVAANVWVVVRAIVRSAPQHTAAGPIAATS